MNLCSGKKRQLVQEQLVREIEENEYHLNTGFLSTPFLLPVLVQMGRPDLAYRLLEQTTYPSWLHPVTLGATTIPESWNGFDKFNGSLNHYSYGAVCDFLFGYVAGIQPLDHFPGYRRFALRPIPGGSLVEASATFECPYGTIVSSWSLQGNTLTYVCEVPIGTEAELCLPNGETYTLTSGKYRFITGGNETYAGI